MASKKKPTSGHDSRAVFLLHDHVAKVSEAARTGKLSEPQSRALESIVQSADARLEMVPPSVMDKEFAPPSQDKHDYASLAIYYWPNPDTPDGLPYVARDGLVNPEVSKYDRPGQLSMDVAVQNLSVAWALTGDERYAAKAGELLRTWFLDPATRMNPHMLYAQHIPGNEGVAGPPGCPPRWVPGVEGQGLWVAYGGVIEGCTLPVLVDSAELLTSSKSWTAEDDAGLRGWFAEFAHWLRTHQHGKDEDGAPNNHATWYQVQVARYLMYSGQPEVAAALIRENVFRLIRRDIEPDGSMPTEYNRAIGLHYVTFTLNAFANLAMMAEAGGVDLWNHATEDGRSIRAAIDWALPYWRGEAWPYKPMVKPFGYASSIPVLGTAARAYDDPKYLDAAQNVPETGDDHPHRLLYLPG